MNIDLSLLHSQTIKEIKIDGIYSIPKEYYTDNTVIKAENINVIGKVYMSQSIDDIDELVDHIQAKITGCLIIEDSISLEPLEYPISIEYDDILEENCKKNENTLDIFQFLWENIVLEIPLQFTKVEDLSKFHGDGWRLISEDELKTSKNNPFSELLKDYKEE